MHLYMNPEASLDVKRQWIVWFPAAVSFTARRAIHAVDILYEHRGIHNPTTKSRATFRVAIICGRG